MAFTKLYFSSIPAKYAPPTIRGAYASTSEAAACCAAIHTTVGGGQIANAQGHAASTTQSILLYRAASTPLAAQTITGTMDVGLIVNGYSYYDLTTGIHAWNWHVHVYVTEGDTDSVRGTLIDNYTEPAETNEWSWSNEMGHGFIAPVAMSSVAVSDGDRIIIELGFIDHFGRSNNHANLYYGTTRSGANVANVPMPDVVVGKSYDGFTAWNRGAAWAAFSDPIDELDVATHVSQLIVETATRQAATMAIALSQAVVETATKNGANYKLTNSQMVIEVITKPWPPNDGTIDGGGGIIFGGGSQNLRYNVPDAIICRVWPIGNIKFPCPDEGETRSRCLSPEQELQNDMD